MGALALGMTWQDIKKQNKIASDWLLHYGMRREEYFKMLSNFSELAATQYNGMPHGSGVGNPTAQKAVALSKLKHDELWIMTMEDVERIIGPKKAIFLTIRREAEYIKYDGDVGRPDWAGYVQINYSKQIMDIYGCEDLPSEKTMRNWWNQMIDVAVRVAMKRGCL